MIINNLAFDGDALKNMVFEGMQGVVKILISAFKKNMFDNKRKFRGKLAKNLLDMALKSNALSTAQDLGEFIYQQLSKSPTEFHVESVGESLAEVVKIFVMTGKEAEHSVSAETAEPTRARRTSSRSRTSRISSMAMSGFIFRRGSCPAIPAALLAPGCASQAGSSRA